MSQVLEVQNYYVATRKIDNIQPKDKKKRSNNVKDNKLTMIE